MGPGIKKIDLSGFITTGAPNCMLPSCLNFGGFRTQPSFAFTAYSEYFSLGTSLGRGCQGE